MGLKVIDSISTFEDMVLDSHVAQFSKFLASTILFGLKLFIFTLEPLADLEKTKKMPLFPVIFGAVLVFSLYLIWGPGAASLV